MPFREENKILEFFRDYKCKGEESEEYYYSLISGSSTNSILLKIAAAHECIAPELDISYKEESNEVTYTSEYPYHKRCLILNYNKIVIPVRIEIHFKLTGEVGRHSTLLIIDKGQQKIIYYDSSGNQSVWYDSVYKFLKEEMEKHYEGYDFGSLNNSCPISLNNMGSGICAAYTIFIYWMLIEYPHVKPIEVLNFLKNIPERFEFMKKFICYIGDFARENKLVKISSLYSHNKIILTELQPHIDKQSWDNFEENNEEYYRKLNYDGLLSLFNDLLSLYHKYVEPPRKSRY